MQTFSDQPITMPQQTRGKKGNRIAFRTDWSKREVIKDGMRKFGWFSAGPRDPWNIYWASASNSRQFFRRDTHGDCTLNDNQLINHFPNSYVLTRKDFFAKMLKEYQNKTNQQQKRANVNKNKASANSQMMPVSFVLPQDYATFIREYENDSRTTWIMKPCSSSRGNGIFLAKSLDQVKRWKKNYLRKFRLNNVASDEMVKLADKQSYVISKYIENPMIIGGKKFDLRLYVLVLSFKPLKAYLFQEGFCRFCSKTYSKSMLNNKYVHLTNVSVQKHGEQYNECHGHKWSIANLRLYLESTRGCDVTTALFDQIKLLIVHSLKAVQPVIISDRHCFECYGYDIIIDCHLKPWLIEVNSSPSLKCTSRNDKLLKFKLISAVFSMIAPRRGLSDVPQQHLCEKKGCCNEQDCGFEQLINEGLGCTACGRC